MMTTSQTPPSTLEITLLTLAGFLLCLAGLAFGWFAPIQLSAPVGMFLLVGGFVLRRRLEDGRGYRLAGLPVLAGMAAVISAAFTSATWNPLALVQVTTALALVFLLVGGIAAASSGRSRAAIAGAACGIVSVTCLIWSLGSSEWSTSILIAATLANTGNLIVTSSFAAKYLRQ